MRLVRACAFLALSSVFAPVAISAATFRVNGTDPGPWDKILGVFNIQEASPAAKTDNGILVLGGESTLDAGALADTHLVILEGDSPAARKIGFVSQNATLTIRQICDTHAPNMQIIWEQPVSTHVTQVPLDFEVFAAEKWKSAPVLAGKRTAQGGILWMATPPGATGFERYPYLLHALADLGLSADSQNPNLWAFFDSSYRIRADVDYLARRWRKAGVRALHVAAWHNMEPDQTQDAYLKKLIEACHRNAILVYAWFELPHVSEKFWADHPEWREKTALGQDAQLDWRKLMNLQNRDCRRAVAKEIGALLARFDWDGVNVAELYFESLEGAANPTRFTPMNDDVRAEFKRSAGWDPKLLFEANSPYSAASHSAALKQFLDFRAALASRMQGEWLDVIDQSRSSKPYLDITLTQIDDRFEPGIRDALGADAARSLPLIQARRSTLLVEDPSTLWSLGPDRYSTLAREYQKLTPDRKHIAVDINIIERYQDVYPTKKQTGVELFELVHQAALSFGQVALYFENSLERQDLALLPAAASIAKVAQIAVDETRVYATESTRVAWRGPVEIDGKPWPVQNSESVLVPGGKHTLTPGVSQSPVLISDFNGDIHSALISADSVDLSYSSQSRAVAVFGSPVSSIEIDGAPFWKAATGEQPDSLLLPAGQHLVVFRR